MMIIERALEYQEIIGMTTTFIKELRLLYLEEDEWNILKELAKINSTTKPISRCASFRF